MSDQLVAETTHTKHSRQTSMRPVGFEPIISADGLPQTYVLDRAATRTYKKTVCMHKFWVLPSHYKKGSRVMVLLSHYFYT